MAKRGFERTIKQNTLFKKELYVISGFDAKRIFQQKLVQNSEKRCFQPTIEQNTVLKEELAPAKMHFLARKC